MARKLRKMVLNRVDLVPAGANPDAHIMLFKAAEAEIDKAEWTTALVNTFPDSSFAYVEPGDKDAEGKTTPRSKRHLPYKDKDGTPDAPHVRNALARLSQSDIPASAQASAKRKLLAAAKTLGIEAQDDTAKMAKQMDGEDAEAPTPLTTLQVLQQRQLWQQWGPLWWAFCDSVQQIMDGDEDDAGYANLLIQSIDEFRSQAESILSGLGLLAKAAPLWALHAELSQPVAVVKADYSARVQAAMTAVQAQIEPAMPRAVATEKGASMADAQELKKAQDRIAALDAEVVALKAKYEPEQEDVWKGVHPAVRKQFEEQQARLAEAEAIAKTERDQRERTEYIQKTATYRQVGLAPDDWEVLKAIDTLPEKSKTRILTLLKAANETLRQSKLFAEIGVEGGTGEGESATEQARALAKAHVEKGTAKDLAEGLSMVFKTDGALYQRYTEEQQTRSRVR